MIFHDFPGFPWKFPVQILIDSIVTRHEPVCQISARCDDEKWVYESVENSKEIYKIVYELKGMASAKMAKVSKKFILFNCNIAFSVNFTVKWIEATDKIKQAIRRTI